MRNCQMQHNEWLVFAFRESGGAEVCAEHQKSCIFEGLCGLRIVAGVSVDTFPCYPVTDLLLETENLGCSMLGHALVVRLSVERKSTR
jgi:hypothetical protein